MSNTSLYSKKTPVFVCIFLAIVCLVFIIFGHRNREAVQLALKKEFITLPATTVDWWSVSHIFLYFIYGLMIPNYHSTFLIIGIIFEVIEDALCNEKDTQLVDCEKKKRHIMCIFSQNDDYWYGKWDDIFMNLLGYTLGSSLRSMM